MLFWLALTACGWLGGGDGADRARDGHEAAATGSGDAGPDGATGAGPSADVSARPPREPTRYWADIDGDGYGGKPWSADAYGTRVDRGGDCDEYDERIHPGAADDWCDGLDEDCDGVTDEDATDVADWYPDADGDGFGDASATPERACRRRPGTVATAGDCDDRDPLANPRERETCDGADDDCDGLVDAADPDMAGDATWYADDDGDGWGGDVVGTGCVAPPGAVRVPGDCDDHAPLVWQAGCAAPRARLTLSSPPGQSWLVDADGDGLADVLASANEGWGGAGMGWTGYARGGDRGEISWKDVDGWLDIGATPYWLVDLAPLGDPDGDGREQLAVASSDDDDQQVWLLTMGTGAATVAAALTGRIDLGDVAPIALWAPDLDGDGTREVVVEYAGAEDAYESGVLAFRASAGERTVDDALATAKWSALHDPEGYLGFADLDGDGADEPLAVDACGDVVIADVGAELLEPADLPGPRIRGAEARSVAAADLDGDGYLDLQVDGSAYYLGPFSSDRDAGAHDAATAAARLGDIDGDGLPDAVGSDRHGAFVVHGPLLGVMTATQPAFGVTEGDLDVEGLADADGDGRADVLFSRSVYDGLELFLVSGADE